MIKRFFIVLGMLLAQAVSVNAQNVVIGFQGMASIESAAAACQGRFEIGKPTTAVFAPANVGQNGNVTTFAFSTDPDGRPKVPMMSFMIAGPAAANAAYDAVQIDGRGGFSGYSGIIAAAFIKPATITPSTKLVDVVLVIRRFADIPNCTVKVRGALVYSGDPQ